MRTKLKVHAVVLITGAALGCLTGLSSSCTRPQASALKPIDQAALQTMVDTTAKELLIPGAVVLLRTPQGEFMVSYGTTVLGANSPPRADTHFRIGSNTKTMTAAVIMQLAQENKLSLDDPVSKYAPGVPNGDNITITELLNMRSGLYNYTDAPEVSESLDRDPTKVWTPDEVLAIAFKHPPYFPPGAAFHYDNTNYALLGLIAEKIDGKPLASCFRDRLFGPLGMTDTELPASTSNTLPGPYSHGYMYGSSSFALVDQEYPPDIQAAARAGTLKPNDYTNQNPSYASAAGGVISTANDLVTWMQALVGGRVFNADYQHQWFDSLQPEDPKKPDGQQYGYGIAQLRWGANALYFHGGEMPGFNSFMGYDPASKMTLVIWTNLTVSLDGKPTANALMLKVLDQIYLVSPLR
jgi:D-alanyl-D-alanine carboxypeptidase